MISIHLGTSTLISQCDAGKTDAKCRLIIKLQCTPRHRGKCKIRNKRGGGYKRGGLWELVFSSLLLSYLHEATGFVCEPNYSDKNENLYSSAHWTKQKFNIKGASDFQLLLFHFFLSRSRTLLGTTLIKGKGQYSWSLWFSSPNQHPKAANNEISDSSLQILVKTVSARYNIVSVSNAETRANIEIHFIKAGNKKCYCRFL